MKRLLLLAALAGLAAAPAANAGTWSGVVIASDAAQHAIVTASADGTARTVRVGSSLRTLQVGRRVTVRATMLGDRTFRASHLALAGRAARVRFSGVVVSRTSSNLLLSAGGSIVSVNSRSDARAGSRVRVAAAVRNGGLTATSVQVTSQAFQLELEGIFLGRTTDGKLRVAVAKRGEVLVGVPATLTLPTLNPRDEVRLVVSVNASGAFTLVSIRADDDNDDDGEEIEVKGTITSLSAASITVTHKSGAPVTCTIPTTKPVSRFKVGDRVEMECVASGTALVLTKLKHEDDEDEDEEDGDNNDGDHGDGDHGDHHDD